MILRVAVVLSTALLPALALELVGPPKPIQDPQETPAPPAAEPAPAEIQPPAAPQPPARPVADVETAIPAAVQALGIPSPLTLPGALGLAVSATTEAAQTHVIHGINHLHGGWEFEATRHFAAAMRIDPECLLAHWGMVMALLNPSPETSTAQVAAIDRLLFLVDAGKGTDLERGYAYALIKYLEEGPSAATNAFRLVSEKFPNDLQSPIFLSLFSRGGYDELGTATPDQQTSEKRLETLIEKHPENPVPLNALLSIRAEAPDLLPSLDLARKLCQLAPDYAPYFHLLGHYEWRTGNHARATAAFDRALRLFDAWMAESQASLADCPGWVRAETYRITALSSTGQIETALAAARKLAAREFPLERAASPGARLLQWDARSLPARLLLHSDTPGATADALESLPSPESMRPYHTHCLAHWWIDGLRIALEAKRLLETGKTTEATTAIAALTHHGEQMAKVQPIAVNTGERSAWNRAFRALEVVASEVRGHAALIGPKSGIGSAYNWFRSAADRQRHATALNPPMILSPMASRVGDYYLATDRPADAVDAFQEALEQFPNDLTSLTGLQRAATAAKLPEKAAAAAAAIKAMQEP